MSHFRETSELAVCGVCRIRITAVSRCEGRGCVCVAGSHSGGEERGLQSRWEVVGFSQ